MCCHIKRHSVITGSPPIPKVFIKMFLLYYFQSSIYVQYGQCPFCWTFYCTCCCFCQSECSIVYIVALVFASVGKVFLCLPCCHVISGAYQHFSSVYHVVVTPNCFSRKSIQNRKSWPPDQFWGDAGGTDFYVTGKLKLAVHPNTYLKISNKHIRFRN